MRYQMQSVCVLKNANQFILIGKAMLTTCITVKKIGLSCKCEKSAVVSRVNEY